MHSTSDFEFARSIQSVVFHWFLILYGTHIITIIAHALLDVELRHAAVGAIVFLILLVCTTDSVHYIDFELRSTAL